MQIYRKARRSYTIGTDCPNPRRQVTPCPRKDSAPSRARHRRTFAVRRKQRRQDSDAKAIPNNLRDKPCETKPTDEKARESGQIACNRNAATTFPLSLYPVPSLSPSISRDVTAVSAVADLSLPAT